MGTVIMHNVVSVDGFIADDNDNVGPLHEWYFSGDTPIIPSRDPKFDHSGTEFTSRSPGHRPSTSGPYGSPSASS
ncbi:MAG TPA: hypothetical protein VFJ19_15880 [Nocardioidaceae bacterium]|nr:hypothetical protein [Nocardioidaceae bacterium]